MPKPESERVSYFCLDPDAFYYEDGLLSHAGLSQSALAAGRKSGGLRAIRKGTRFLYRGSDLISWLASPAWPGGDTEGDDDTLSL